MFYIKSLNLHLIAENLYPFTNLSLFFPSPAPGNHFLDFLLKKKNVFKICCNKSQGSAQYFQLLYLYLPDNISKTKHAIFFLTLLDLRFLSQLR